MADVIDIQAHPQRRIGKFERRISEVAAVAAERELFALIGAADRPRADAATAIAAIFGGK